MNPIGVGKYVKIKNKVNTTKIFYQLSLLSSYVRILPGNS